MTGADTIDLSRARPATPKMLAARRSILTAKREYRLIALLWQSGSDWLYLPGWWDDDRNAWVADCVLTGGYDIPSVVSHWAEMG